MAKIVSKQEAEKIRERAVQNLPPAGDARRDELKRRDDTLQADAEVQGKDMGAIDPNTFDPNMDVLAYVNELEVSGAREGFHYRWLWTGRSGYFIKMASSQGYVLVQGDDPEARELKDPAGAGLRRLVDVVLMRAPLAQALWNQKRCEALAAQQAQAVTQNLRDMGRHRGIVVLTEEDAANPTMQAILKKYGAQQAATKIVGEMTRRGTIPGMPAPGVHA